MKHSRAVTVGTAGALALGSIGVGTHFVRGADAVDETVFVPITPCRLIDTRPGDVNVGPRSTKIAADDTATFGAHDGTDADSTCEIPASATAIATNTVAIAPTARSFMTLFPGDVDNPGTANLNYVAGQAPTPNAANVPLSPSGEFNVYNAFGEVHVVMDVNGYYQPSSNVGSTGPAGPAGPAGSNGTPGPAGAPGADGADGAPNRISDEQILLGQWYDDPGRPAVIDVGDLPQGIASDGTRVFVANHDDDDLSIVDPVGNIVTGTLPLGTSPRGIAYDGTHMYVTTDSNTVIVVDPATEAIVGSPIPVGVSPRGVGFANGKIYVGNQGSISVINTATKAVVATITTSVTASHASFATDGEYMYVTDGQNNDVYVIDTATDTLVGSEIAVDPGPNSIVHDGQYVYVASSFFTNVVTVIDPDTLTVIDTFTVGSSAGHIAYDGNFLYVTDSTDDVAHVVDPRSRAAVSTIELGSNPGRIMFDGTNLFVIDGSDDTVTKVLPF
jgi:YVTN family beta-propeller protein